MRWSVKTVGMLAVGLSMLWCNSCRGADVRPAAVAGQFYERMPVALDMQVAALLKAAVRPAVTGQLVAAVVPHAGYVYSGRCAASVYALVSTGAYERIIILSPSHHAAFSGISLPAPGLKAYETPLGSVAIDKDVCDALRGRDGFGHAPGADTHEHAIEVQLPLLQKTAGSFRLVPLMCGQMTTAQVEAAGKALAPYVGGRTLILASSDFTHYGPNYGFVPFARDVPAQLQGMLSRAADCVTGLDEEGFARHGRETGDTICGAMPIRVLMRALRESGTAVHGQVLSKATSGEMTGSYENSVSYAAIGFLAGKGGNPPVVRVATSAKEGHAVKEKRSGEWSPGLTEAEKQTLFAIARDTLRWCVQGKQGKFRFDAYTLTPLMQTNMATFVTLKIGGHLRGCIGSLAPVEPLYLSVHGNAINAALRDPRFAPVSPDELADIEVDVSILSPIRDIPSASDFKIGQQGIIMEKGMHRAVYLPEVAVEQRWSVQETLSSLSMKAGLGPDAWREGARFKVFESVVLSE